jgi:hypothetical protein
MAPVVLCGLHELEWLRRGPWSCASLCHMPKTLRQPRHSCLASRSRARASLRALLLCAMAASCVACPAVVDLDDPEPDVADDDNFVQADAAGPAQPATDAAGSDADAQPGASEPRPQGVIPTPAMLDENRRCPPPHPPPTAPEDAGAPDASSGGRAAAGQNHPPDPDVAVRAVLAAGYSLPCGAEQTHVLQVPDGYELSALGRSGLCAPFAVMLYRLRVSKSGHISLLSAVPASPAQLACDAGEPVLAPDLLGPPLA